MKWFQHDSNAGHDAKIKKLILRHGAEGYAVYFHCLELIAGDLTQQNITFELEHDAEIIADNLKIKGDNETSGIDKVNKILKTIIDSGLFIIENNRVFCFKMANRLDNTVSRAPEINKIKQLRSNYVAATKKLGAEENRIEYKRREEKKEEENKHATKVANPPLKKFSQINSYLLDRIWQYLKKNNRLPVIASHKDKMYHSGRVIIDALVKKDNPVWVLASFAWAIEQDFWKGKATYSNLETIGNQFAEVKEKNEYISIYEKELKNEYGTERIDDYQKKDGQNLDGEVLQDASKT